MTHLIFVRYDPNLASCLSPAVVSVFESVHIVWTSQQPGQILSSSNESLEFSGYQEGLGRLLASLETRDGAHHQNNSVKTHHAVVFANDTVFSGHLTWMSDYLFHAMGRLGAENQNRTALTGLVMPVNADIACLTGSQGYVSSWIFMLEGSLDKLKRVRFYEPKLVLKNFPDISYLNQPMTYINAVERWLKPESLFQGWYKALPGETLPDETLQRKRFAIYLEHTMPQRLGQQGFEMNCISKRLSVTERVVLYGLRTLDRIYVNLIKIRFRLAYRFSVFF